MAFGPWVHGLLTLLKNWFMKTVFRYQSISNMIMTNFKMLLCLTKCVIIDFTF